MAIWTRMLAMLKGKSHFHARMEWLCVRNRLVLSGADARGIALNFTSKDNLVREIQIWDYGTTAKFIMLSHVSFPLDAVPDGVYRFYLSRGYSVYIGGWSCNEMYGRMCFAFAADMPVASIRVADFLHVCQSLLSEAEAADDELLRLGYYTAPLPTTVTEMLRKPAQVI